MTTEDGAPELDTVGVEGYTEPALAYRTDGGEPTVAAANEAFRGLADEPRGERLSAVTRRCLGEPLTLPAPSGPVRFRARPETAYLPRVVHETGGGGHLLFVARQDTDGVGPEAVARVVSHDLRNPLDVAKAHLQVARDERAADPEEDHLAAVARAHDRMEQIIEDVLTLARGSSAVEPTPGVDLEARLRSAWAGVATEHVALTVESPLPETAADGPRVERLFENLLRNAVEHAGERPTVRAGGLDGGFYVADDGEGVPPADREAVFEPGYTDSETGTGLGLAIVARIASAHGWRVSFTESRDGGARVEVRFDGGEPS